MANNIGFEAIRQDLGNFANEKVKHNTNTVDVSTDDITNTSELNVKFEQLDAQIVTIFSSLQTIQTQLNNITPFNASMLEPFAKKVQTFNTDTIYVDSQNGKAYKMYIVNDSLALEEIELPQNI